MAHDPDVCGCGVDTLTRGSSCPCQCKQWHRDHDDACCGRRLETACDECRVKMRRRAAEFSKRDAEVRERHRLLDVAKRFKEVTGISLKDLRAALLQEAKTKR